MGRNHRKKPLNPNNEIRVIQEEKNLSEERRQMLRREEARLRREHAEETAPILSPEVRASFAGMAIGLSMKAHLRGLTEGLAGIPIEDEKPADELNAIKELHPPA